MQADGRRNKRLENRNRYIYLAQAIDLNPGSMMADAANLAARVASEALQLPVFNPKAAWSMSLVHPGPNGDPGRDALVGANQTLALAADLLVAVVDLVIPSWGMPFEVLERAKDSTKPILVVCPRNPNQWPMYLQWVLGGNATWLDPTDLTETDSDSVMASALDRLGIVRVM